MSDSNTPAAPAPDANAPKDVKAAAEANDPEKGPKKEAAQSAASSPHRPAVRSLVHFGALLLALPLTWLAGEMTDFNGRAWAAGICLFGAVFNLLVLRFLPLGKKIFREGEGLINGVWLYPLSLALAFLVFPPWVVGAAWAVLAAGDAAASTAGRMVPHPKLPWSEKKSWAGTLSFLVLATPACFMVLAWIAWLGSGAGPAEGRARVPEAFLRPTGLDLPMVWTVCVIAAAAGAILESLEGPFDDNLRVTLGVCVAAWLTVQLFMPLRQMAGARQIQPEWLLHALVANAILAAAVLALRFADLPGALAGGLAGAAVYFLARPQGYALLILFVVGGSLLSRIGRKTKEARGAAEARGGKRGIANVAANLGVPVLCVLAYPAFRGAPEALVAYAGALAAAFADTASSEIGALSAKRPVLITTREEVPHGTDGAVSLLGYAGALFACVLFAGAAWASGFWRFVESGNVPWSPEVPNGHGVWLSLIAVAAGLFGTTVDSVLGARIEGKVPGVGKGAVNFVCTLSGAAAAWAMASLLY